MLTINANNYAVTITRADDQTIRFTVTDSAGAVVDVSSGTFKFTVKQSLDDAIGDAKFQKTSPAGSGIDLTNGATGIVDVLLVPVDTSTLEGLYYYDLEMTLSSKVRTLRTGLFMVRKDVSTPGAAPTSSGVVVAFPDGLEVTAIYLKDTATGRYIKVTNDGGFPDFGPDNAGPPPY